MLGHNVEIYTKEQVYTGVLVSKDTSGAGVTIKMYNENRFIPMHRIIEIKDKGYRGSW